ncbi:MAG TPA: cation:proton antiporter [Burkholderiales bacterium]|nr:cation:proton antiporter [Burkholderiales bacterium]
MQEGSFLPSFPLAGAPLVLFGFAVLCALAVGHAVVRYVRLPRITGFVLAGLLLGPSALNVLDAGLLENLRIFVDVSLGLILFELGRRLDIAWFKRDRWLAASSVAESLLAFLLVLAVLRSLGIPAVYAATAAAIAMVTSPAVIMMVVSDERAQGPFTERLLTLTAANNVFAFLFVTVLIGFIHAEQARGWVNAVAHPPYLLFGSLALGYAAFRALHMLARWLPRQESVQFALVVGLAVVTVGAANGLKLSVLIALLALGVFVRNLDRERDILAVEFGPGAQIFFIVLFVLSGAGIEVKELAAGGLLGLAVLAARFAGKLVGIAAFGPLSGVGWRNSALLALAMSPISAVALVMMHGAADFYPEFGAALRSIVAAMVITLEIVGPLATQFALKRAGETLSLPG